MEKAERARLQAQMVRLAEGDSSHPFVVPGFAVHDEIEQFVEAGLTPYQALSAATRNAAEFMSASGEFGVVARGARADLVLLEANPLEDVRNLSRITGVMVHGH
jgi:imidazolonepropionase-like amidohydrolase